MGLDKYKLLKNKNIAEILDGDETFGDFESPNIQSNFGLSNFGLSNLQIGLPRLSGPDICDIAKMFGSTVEYEGSYSRWQYMFDLIDYGIQSGRIS